MTSVIENKTIININGDDVYFEVYQVDQGVITGFKLGGRIFKEITSDNILEVKEDEINNVSNINNITNISNINKINNVSKEIKVCSKCKKEKQLSEFYPNKGACKECVSLYNKKYVESKKNKEDNPGKPKPSYIKIPGEKTITPSSEPKGFYWNEKRDRVLRDAFDELGVSGIFDKGLLPGFSLTDIRKRCMELCLIDEYGNIVKKNIGR